MVKKKSEGATAVERETARRGGKGNKDIKELAARPQVSPGDPKAMQLLLGTFAHDEAGNLYREFETKSDDGKHFASLASYRQLLAPIGASIGPLSEGGPVENDQGITFEVTRKLKMKTECKITIPPEAFMQMSAAYGFEAESKLSPKDKGRWEQVKADAHLARAAASSSPRL